MQPGSFTQRPTSSISNLFPYPQADAYYQIPRRGADGNWLPIETAQPMNGPFVGGFGPRGGMSLDEGQHGSISLPEASATGFMEPCKPV